MRHLPSTPSLLVPALLMPVLLAFGGGCAPAHPGQGEPVLTRPVALFVSPDSAAVAALKGALGEEAFYVVADDENWYRALAFDLLDSLGVEARVVEGRRFTFLVGGAPQAYDWSGEARPWFVVLYDGEGAPVVTSSVDLPAALAASGVGRSGRPSDR